MHVQRGEMNLEIRKTDVVIVGSGVAGLYTGMLLSTNKEVTVITKENIENSNSYLAQGGIAAAINKNDNWENHYKDTITAGANHNIEVSTKELVQAAPNIIKQLIDLGVPFDRDNNQLLNLGREGGHGQRRIVHAGGDSTGKEITTKLIEFARKNLMIYEHEVAIDLLVSKGLCNGILTKNSKGEIIAYLADQTILATGGVGGLYSVTSNDKTISGDGIAMAYRAGAELIDLEFIQFHPTMLTNNGKTFGLVSEAVRGEGARLIDQKGKFIMEHSHPLKDLAPRDVVARRIYEVMENGDQVFLDISYIKNFEQRFPTISANCINSGIDLNTKLLPIAPGAHFIMGGVKTNIYGETSIKALYAAGEVAFTGVHGANRLASNSLLEGIVFANKLADWILEQPKQFSELVAQNIITENLQLPTIKQIQEIMMTKVGIVRHKDGLTAATSWFKKSIPDFKVNTILDLPTDQITKLNMITVGWLIASSALKRTESRGGHFRMDYPVENNNQWLKRYIVRRRDTDEQDKTKNIVTTAIS